MKHIEYIDLHNFESHKKSRFTLTPGLNVFAGTSDHGKSSIIRAASFALSNQISGDFLSTFADIPLCEVEIMFDDGYIIRKKDGKDNIYLVATDDEEHELSAMKKNLPVEVSSITNMDYRNIQGQHDGYFMLGSHISPGKVAKLINKITGNSDIDVFFQKIKAIIRQCNHQKKYIDEDLKKTRETLESTKWIREAFPQVKKLEYDYNELLRLQGKTRRLSEITSSLSENKESKKRIDKWLTVEKPFSVLNKKVQRLIRTEKKRHSIERILLSISQKREEIKKLRKTIHCEKQINELKLLIQRADSLRTTAVPLQRLITSIKRSKKEKHEADRQVTVISSQYTSLLRKNNICPWCGQSTKDI